MGNYLNAALLSGIAVLAALSMSAANAQVLLPTNDVGLPDSSFTSANTCRRCHTKQYNEWRSSMMSYSSISPPIHALELTENHTQRDMFGDGSVKTAFGRFARTRIDEAGSAPGTRIENQLFCQKCHAPVSVFTDLFADVVLPDLCPNGPDEPYCEESRGSIKDSHDLLIQIAASAIGTKQQNAKVAAAEGITCTVCHQINGQEPAGSNERFRPGFAEGIANSGYRIDHFTTATSLENRILRGPYNIDDLDPPLMSQPPSSAHGLSASSPDIVGADLIKRPYIQTGEFCGSCHDVRMPVDDINTDDGFRRVENLFTEWEKSPWNDPFSPNNPREVIGQDASGNDIKQITTCQDCHMSQFMLDPDAKPGDYLAGQIANAGRAVERPRVTNHRFMGVDRFLVLDLPDESFGLEADLEAFDISEIGINEVGRGFFSDLSASYLDYEDRDSADLREVILQKAVDFKISSAKATGGLLVVEVTAENIGAGHRLPSGLSQERQVWIELEVLNKDGNHVFTSGYMTPLEETTELFDPRGDDRYRDSFCGAEDGKYEYECDLDAFRAKLNNSLDIISLEEGADAEYLVNYQNGFTLNGAKVFSQFIGNSIDNSNSLAPFEPQVERYEILVNPRDSHFTINARLRFRPLPHEFLAALQKVEFEMGGRVTKDVIKRNRVIEMEWDSCVTGGQGRTKAQRCPRPSAGRAVKSRGRGSKKKKNRG